MTHKKYSFEFENVSFSWPGGRLVLKNQSFSLPQGAFALVSGPSGSGKSTLLRLMNRLEQPQTGRIRCLGTDLTEWFPPKLRQQATYLQQSPVIQDLSVRETLLQPFQFQINKEKAPPADSTILDFLDRVNLGMVQLEEPAAALSGGQRQRLSLLRALFLEPEILLLDEPTASLDRESKNIVETMAVEYCEQGKTVIMITHDKFMPRQVAVLTLDIRDGRVTLCP